MAQTQTTAAAATKIVHKIHKKPLGTRLKRDMQKNWVVYVIVLPVVLYFLIFNYIPMFGIVMAFQDFKAAKGFFGSKFVGFDNFAKLFSGEEFGLVLRNTSMMALLNLTIGFIFPIVFALLLSSVRPKWFKRMVQISSYMPYFIATVVVVQLFTEFLGRGGIITTFLGLFGVEDQNLLANPDIPTFWLINCGIEIWQGCGYGAIVYCAAISNVNPNLHEAAAIDGASRWKRLWNVTIPSIMPLVMTMLTLRVGLVFTQGFDKVILFIMPKTQNVADCLATYINRYAFEGVADYSLAAAAGLFQSVIATILLIVSNSLQKRVMKSSLF